MTTNLQLIEERQKLSSLMTSILEGNVIDENGEVILDSEDLQRLEELQLSLDDNEENIRLKTEAILFAVESQQSKLTTYKDTAKYYNRLAERTQKTIEWLNNQVRLNIERVGENGRLPTPTFPKLKLTKPRQSTVINEEYSGELDPDILKPQTIKDVSKTLAKEKYGDDPPLDEDYNPLYQIVYGEPSISYK